MDLTLQYEQRDGFSCVLDTVIRREETQESIVSDSMPDIGVVVTASATPLLHTCRLNGNGLDCRGEAAVSILYQPENGGEICALSLAIPFQCTEEGEKLNDSCRVNAWLRLLAVHVKLLNPRKLWVQIELSLHLLAFQPTTLRYPTDVTQADDALQRKQETVSVQLISQVTEKQFSYEEHIPLSGSQRDATQLLGYEAIPYCSETKLVGSKVVFKGGIKLRTRMRSAAGALVCEDYELPVSQVLDAGDSGEQAVAAVDLSLVELQLELEEHGLEVQMELYACATLIDRQEFNLLQDAYSTRSDCQCREETQERFWLTAQEQMLIPFRQVLDVVLPSAQVLDQSAVLAEVLPSGSDGDAAAARLKLSVCLQDRDGHLTRLEQNCTIALALPVHASAEDTLHLEVKLLECVCIAAAGGMEVRGSLLAQYALEQRQTIHFVQQITCTEENQETGQHPSAVLRKLKAGETLWELGKEYHATVADILAVNQIGSESEARNAFLLIPRSR